MPRNPAGVYTLPPSNPVVTATPISSAGWANPTLADIAAALTESLTKSGLTTSTADQPMGGFKHNNVGPATSLTNYARVDQVQNGTILHATPTTMPTPDVYETTLPFGATTFIQGQLVVIEFPTTNVGLPTLNVNSAGARPIVKVSGANLAAGTIRVGTEYILIFDGVSWRILIDSTGLTNAEVAGSLGYQPIAPDGHVPMTAQLTLVSPPVAPTDASSKAYVDAQIAAVGAAGVLSVNGRTGVVNILSADVTGALGYTPFPTGGGTMTGSVTLISGSGITLINGAFVGKEFRVIATSMSVTGTADFQAARDGQSLLLTLTGNLAISAIMTDPGEILRLTFILGAFNVTSWPASVKWPGGVVPTLNGGTLKKAVVVLENDGTGNIYLANASVY